MAALEPAPREAPAGVYNLVHILKVHDAEGFARYVRGHTPTLLPFGGRFVARGPVRVIEGTTPAPRTVIQHFPSEAAFEAWYHSDAYRPWKRLRQQCAQVQALLIPAC